MELNNTTKEERQKMLDIINAYRKAHMHYGGVTMRDKRKTKVKTNIAGNIAKWWSISPRNAKKHCKRITKLLPEGYKMSTCGSLKKPKHNYPIRHVVSMWLIIKKKKMNKS